MTSFIVTPPERRSVLFENSEIGTFRVYPFFELQHNPLSFEVSELAMVDSAPRHPTQMKVLGIITYYRPHWTGLTRHAVRIAEHLASRGHEVTVLTTRHSAELPGREPLNDVDVIRLQPIARFSRGMIVPGFPAAAVKHILRADVVHIHTPLPESLLVAGICRVAKRPLVMTHHGDVVMPPGIRNRMIERAAYRISRASARLATVVTSYSDDYAEHSALLSPFANKVVSIDPPVTMPKPIPERVVSWRQDLGLSDKPVVGFSGRWVREKGLDLLLEAMPRVRDELPEAHFVFAGERSVAYEDDYARCRDLIDAQHEHITLIDLLRDPQEMADFYAMCDVLALPSRTDMFAMVQVEAMLCGTPVVATDIPGARVVVERTKFGRLVRPNDPLALAAGIVEILRNPSSYQPTPATVGSEFDPETTLHAYEELLETAVHKKRAAVVTSPPESSNGVRHWSSLSTSDHEILDHLLRNEADMAYRRRARILLDYLDLRDGQHILDSGCGTGFHAMAIRRLRAVDVVGLDTARDRLLEARGARASATLIHGALSRLPFSDASFDAMLLSEVLEHVEDDREALLDAHRVLKPGGVLAISVPHARYPFLWDPINWSWTALGGSPIRKGPIAGIWSNHETLYEPEKLTDTLRAVGFGIEIVEEATHFSFPFIHFLVYGIGKPLLERDLLPTRLRQSVDRLHAEHNSTATWNPITLGVAMFRWVDRLNDRPDVARKQSFVNVLVKARKPRLG